MKFLAPTVGALLLASLLAACGSTESSNATDGPQVRMSAAEIEKLPPLAIEARRTPMPHGLVVRDVRKGSGAVMKAGDTVLIDWAEVPYGESYEGPPGTPAKRQEFTLGKYIPGWEKGLPGMRVGGRRELVVPERLGDTGRTMVYVIDLLGVKPA